MNEKVDMKKLSPMMKQYMEIKAQHKNHLVLFRMGDFYELFFDDALLVSRELQLTLTGKECGLKERAPMCGMPYHSVDTYIKRLVGNGHKVAICEQMEDPATAKGLVSRDVVRIITPGTLAQVSMLNDAENNYICSLYITGESFGIAFADISTGMMCATEMTDGARLSAGIINELERFSPAELLYNTVLTDHMDVITYLHEHMHCTAELIEDDQYDPQTAKEMLTEQFQTLPKDLDQKPFCLCALGVLLSYLKKTQKDGVQRLIDLQIYSESQFMSLDAGTRRNLELMQTMRTGERQGSLLWVLDHTKTAMGKRLMRKTIQQPLIHPDRIIQRQEAVAAFLKRSYEREEFLKTLNRIYDLERLMTKVIYSSVQPRDLSSLAQTLGYIPSLKEQLSAFDAPLLRRLNGQIDDMKEIHDLLSRALCDNPPLHLKDGGVIKDGFCKELDELRKLRESGVGVLSQIEEREKERTGIPKLRVAYNRVFGYYIEVTKSYLSQVPDNYIRRQTLTGSERFTTAELQEYEHKILTASENILSLEQELFDKLRCEVTKCLVPMQQTAEAIAMVDVLCSFAHTAQERRYVRPKLSKKREIVIKEGRHPVVEAVLDFPFVPNDTTLDDANNRMMVITGPNMAGKSTYMRQVALIVLMTQIGSFVPAQSAEIGIVDKIFTRVGASDDLAAGQSTFMVEMSEVAGILKNATNHSLVILDEIGRGTSTFDGMSIAKAVAEYLMLQNGLGCKTLFATHYHELTTLEQELDGVKNYNIAVKKRGDDITFLRKIIPGGVDDSYGIAVAKLAGIPGMVIQRAHEILHDLESGENLFCPVFIKKEDKEPDERLLLSEDHRRVAKKLQSVTLETLTPLEAMNLLYELKKETMETGKQEKDE